MERMTEIAQREPIDVARRSLSALRNALKYPDDSIVRDAALRRFDLAFETVWRAGQIYLKQIDRKSVV